MLNARIEIRRPETKEELNQAQIAKNEAWGFLTELNKTEKDENGDYPKGSILPIYENFPEGFLTAFVNGEAAGNLTLVRTNYDINNPPHISWEELTAAGTGSNIIPDGDTLYASSLGVSPRFRGQNIGSMLVHQAIRRTVELGCKRFALGCRIPDYYKYCNIPIETYITLKRHDGEFLDRELRFYSRCGLRFLKPLPDYMVGDWADPDCLNYGVLSVWDNPFVKEWGSIE